MKHLIEIRKEIDLRYLEVEISLYAEDVPDDLPFRFCDQWKIVIDVDRGRVMNWHYHRRVAMQFKVGDSGRYTLYDSRCRKISRPFHDGLPEYVPNSLLPPQDGFGDYLALDIDVDGAILNWYETPSLNDLFRYAS